MNAIPRREAITKIYQAMVGVGAGSLFPFQSLLAASRQRINQPALVWLQASACSGCTSSLITSEEVSTTDFITRFTDVVYHPAFTSATGKDATLGMKRLLSSKQKYILVVEGAIPVKMPHACMLDGVPIMKWVSQLAEKASLVIAAGTCATVGGVSNMSQMVTGVMPVHEFFQFKKITTPMINLPGCPLKPEHLMYVMLHTILKKKSPQLDHSNRPILFFKQSVHERCINYHDFMEERFAGFIGDDGCLFRLGCQGPVSNNDCMTNGYNNNINHCIKAGHPCIGCSSCSFPRPKLLHRYNDFQDLGNRR